MNTSKTVDAFFANNLLHLLDEVNEAEHRKTSVERNTILVMEVAYFITSPDSLSDTKSPDGSRQNQGPCRS